MSLVWFLCEIGGCQLCFTVQPAEILYCNPYTNISLECQIEGPFSPTPQILWFSNPQPPLGDTVEIKGSKPGYNIVNTTQFVEMTRTTQSVLTIQNLTAGEYWCQIYVEGMEPEISQKLCITELGDYGRYDECNRANISLETSKCWDIPTTCVTEVPTIMATSSYNSASLNSASPINSVRVLNNGTHATQLVQGLSSLIAATPLTTNGETTPRSSPGRTDELEGLVETPKGFEMWLYIVASLAGLFALLILVLTIICIGLCVLYPRTHPKPLHLHSKTLWTFVALHLTTAHIKPNCQKKAEASSTKYPLLTIVKQPKFPLQRILYYMYSTQ